MTCSLVLFSGGIDSTAALYWARDQYEKVQAITFDYGQRHSIEVLMSRTISQNLDIPQKIFRVDLKQIGGSSLTDPTLPLSGTKQAGGAAKAIPPTYVPFRNGILLSLAAAWADVQQLDILVCGFHVIDAPDYPDTRKPFVQAMERAINWGTKSGKTGNSITILTPFIDKKKSEIIKQGLSLGADYSYSISCYAGQEIPCFRCSSCRLRQQAWNEAGVKDHLIQRLEKEGKL